MEVDVVTTVQIAAPREQVAAFAAHFLGRRLAYTYEVVELVPGERRVMRTQDGSFPMETTYGWQDAPDGGTVMTLRNRGVPAGFAKVTAPAMARAALALRHDSRMHPRSHPEENA